MRRQGGPVLNVVRDPQAGAIAPELDAFLDGLSGPTIFHLPGRDPTRVRVVAGGLHGNEPSGLRAIHRLLCTGQRPAVDVFLFVGAVEAARTEPRLSFRMLPGRRDLNRCFRPPFDDLDGRTAAAALDLLSARVPEAVVDLHNNTGHNPAYGIASRVDPHRLHLVGLFAPRLIRSGLCLGTFMEAFDSLAPAVTIECGRAGDSAADATAYAGLVRLCELERLDPVFISPEPLMILADPVRVCLRWGSTLAFFGQPLPGVDLTLDPEIDRHNFEAVAHGTRLGWLGPDVPWPLEACDESGQDVSRDLFEEQDGELRTKVTLVPIMMTTDEVAARNDCLFYAVHRRQ